MVRPGAGGIGSSPASTNMTETSPQLRAQYLARKIVGQQDDLDASLDALRVVLDEWAVRISPHRLGEHVEVVGVPNWSAQVTEVRAAAGAFEIDDSAPSVAVTVRYLRKDGTLGKRSATFMDGYNHNWKLRPLALTNTTEAK